MGKTLGSRDDNARLVPLQVLGVMLCASAAIGIYYACTGGKQKTAGEFLLGDRQMQTFPVAMSLLASFLSSVTLLGIPAEVS